MKSSHTPGPYSISGIAGDNNIMARVGHERKTVCIATGWEGITPEEFGANKRLFQSAPELLGACKMAELAIQREKLLQAERGESVAVDLGFAHSKLLAAIAKAEAK